MPDGKRRLDVWLVQTGQAESREKARTRIVSRQVTVNGKAVIKPAFAVSEQDVVRCIGNAPRYVGRGGYKLEAAIESAGLDLTGKTALDVGASTGGFTQCMLLHGAKRVVAVDVGSGQLHPTLREDPRVCSLESTDIRRTDCLAPYIPQGGFDCATVDVSFISLSLVLPAIVPLLADGAMLVCLIKPQFEVGRSAIGKGGIVKDYTRHRHVLLAYAVQFASMELEAVRLLPSPLRGGDGNGEYLAVLKKGNSAIPFSAQAVDRAVAALKAMKSDKEEMT